MFDLTKQYGYDKEAAEAGVKMQVGADPKKDYLVVRRIPNKEYSAELIAVMQANSMKLKHLKKQDKSAYDALNDKLLCNIMAKTVLTGWGPGIGADDKKLPYSEKSASEVLLIHDDFRTDVRDFATDNSNYPLQINVEDVKK